MKDHAQHSLSNHFKSTAQWLGGTRFISCIATSLLFILIGAARPPQRSTLLGFSAQRARWERDYERRLQQLIRPDDARNFLRELTSQPHIAGTAGDRRVVDLIAREFRSAGLDTEIATYEVLLGYPESLHLEIIGAPEVQLGRPEPPLGPDAGKPDPLQTDPLTSLPWNGYAASANVTAPVVYVNYATVDDFEKLKALHLDVRGKILLARYFHGYRGGKMELAERYGAAGVLVYSDPADDGPPRGKVYPAGPWGPDEHFQRGAVVFDYKVPGDPLTPGWPSVKGARRLSESDATILPRLPMVPLSARDAREIMRRLGGELAPPDWNGGLAVPYHLGDSGLRIHLNVHNRRQQKQIWDVIGVLRGTDEPQTLVLLGNHHDAWVYGAVDPSSGTASMLVLAHAAGELARAGLRPRRTLVFGNWDAEEYTLTGSTEWGEDHEADLTRNAVACLNVDASASGPQFSVSADPALWDLFYETALDVQAEKAGVSVYANWKRERAENQRGYGVAAAERSSRPAMKILGSGSDYTVFYNHLGIPSADFLFDGPYGVYHSRYDDFDWMDRIGDPGFIYHAAAARIWGALALRLANADTLPITFSHYPAEAAAYTEELKRDAATRKLQVDFAPLEQALARWRDAAHAFDAALRQRPETGTLNHASIQAMRALLEPSGIPERPWFRQLVYAPVLTYEAETLPGVREAIEASDPARARAQIDLLARHVDESASVLLDGVNTPR